MFIPPEGHRLDREHLIAGFHAGYGKNKEFRIEIRDVKLLREMGEYALATYTEWQRGAVVSTPTQNARITTAVMTRAKPFRWLHVQETWLPEQERAAGSFEF